MAVVRLQYRAYVNGYLFEPGVVPNWPDDVKPPSTAEVLDELPPEEPQEEEEVIDTLSGLQKKTGPKSKVKL